MTNYRNEYPKAFLKFSDSLKQRPSIEEYINQYIENFVKTNRSSVYFGSYLKDKEAPVAGCKTVEEEEELLKYCLEHNQAIEELIREKYNEFRKEEEEMGIFFSW